MSNIPTGSEHRASRVDASLDVSQVNQSVTVDASAMTLQADRVEVNTQISDKEVEDLPLTGSRNFQSLLDLVPGVSLPGRLPLRSGESRTGALATNVERRILQQQRDAH